MTNLELMGLLRKKGHLVVEVVEGNKLFEDFWGNQAGMKFTLIDASNDSDPAVLRFVLEVGEFAAWNRKFYTHDFISKGDPHRNNLNCEESGWWEDRNTLYVEAIDSDFKVIEGRNTEKRLELAEKLLGSIPNVLALYEVECKNLGI